MSASTQAVMYQCVDESGARSFTDSPTDSRQCRVAGGTAAPSHSEQDVRSVREAGKPEPPGADHKQPEGMADSRPPAVAAGHVSVPLQTIGRSLAITVRLNGERQARLILDTGATLTLLSRAIARDLGLYGESPVSSALVNTAGGQVTVDVMRIGTIEVGGASVRNVPVAIFDLPDAPPNIEGLLGLSFLSHFLVTLDMEQSELRLTSR
jgi:aspartyl protease family protein